ncbi:hypothetical protein [Streptomyces hiroshimensis]|uniref:Holin n=1 Tax=Streptomyces hiroshimensis TaxID=66424 RepID=A0ABQ2ZCY6_9ACTN|nr:hypothetical protein [Streptomyces hiroshimensis]GGY08438.1 hypothetical protein GCM10010324_64100 [Streptomyces hiroshimensis]
MADGYNDIKAAAKDTQKDIWSAWLFCGIVAIAVAFFTDDDSVTGMIADFVAKWGWIPSTLIALVASGRASSRADEARKRALQ